MGAGEMDGLRELEILKSHLHKYAEIGLNLSGKADTSEVLEVILSEARSLTRADAGTLYLKNRSGTHLDFVLMHNDAMNLRLGGLKGDNIDLPPVPLYENGRENHSNVSSHVALTGELVNIPDVYQSQDFDLAGTRKYDRATGYRSRSMLVAPMRDHENQIIGVLQLLNALDEQTGLPVPFSDDLIFLVVSLASQAAATFTKARLIQDLGGLFEAFIRSIATAVEEKSRYTGGHIARVAMLTQMMAEAVNAAEQGAFRHVSFSREELQELRIAAWLHDVGKIVTPEHIVDKSRKLEIIFDRAELIKTRFALIAKCQEADRLKETLASGPAGREEGPGAEAEYQESVRLLGEELEFVLECNLSDAVMDEQKIGRLRSIAAKRFQCEGGEAPYLTSEELEYLSIQNGTLSEKERRIMESHALVTHKILKELPFPAKMSRVAEYASTHHEKLNGRGYPFKLDESNMPLQSRIMAVADIFEALTARDRPYKRPMQLSRAIAILDRMKQNSEIDPDVHELFVSSGLIRRYAELELNPDQVDIDLSEWEYRKEEYEGEAAERAAAAMGRGCSLDRRGRVLVADDSANTRMLLEYYLRDTPYELELAESLDMGLLMMREGYYDMVLLNLDMAETECVEAVRRIRENEKSEGAPGPFLAAMTSRSDSEVLDMIQETGFDGLLPKPVGKKEFLELVRLGLESRIEKKDQC